MIKNCRISDLPMYGYDIKYNDEVIAKAELLNIRDKTRLFQSLFVKDDDRAQIDMAIGCEVIAQAVKSWEFADDKGVALPITKDNAAMLLPEYVYAMVTAIVNQESAVMASVEGIEKN